MSQLPIDPVMISTTESLAGYRIVRSLGVAEGFAALWFPGIVPSAREALLRDATARAFTDMLVSAAQHGANAIVGLRYANPPGEGTLIAYGTAVLVERG